MRGVIIFDEPTAALTRQEIEQLFIQIERLKSHGVGIIYISHRLEEIFQLGDRVTVLRDGCQMGTWKLTDVDMDFLIKSMVGRDVHQLFPREFGEPKEIILKVSNLSRGKSLRNINLTVRAGEIVGIAGLVGAGRTELMRAIFGADPIYEGEIEVLGRCIDSRRQSPSKAVNMGIGMLPESRKEDGLAISMTLSENIVMSSLKKLFPKYTISSKKQVNLAEKYVKKLNINCRSVEQITSSLSGGTQQKVVIGKWLASGANLLLFDEPTRGIDVGSKAEIHSLMNELVKTGNGILMVSSELPELISMSDRIYVMREGQFVAEVSRDEANQELILAYMMGV